MPPKDYDWPFFQKSKQRVYLRRNHVTGKYGCFKLSSILNGVVCVPCALFATECASNDRGKLTTLGSLVKTPLRNYRSLTGKDSSLDSHLLTNYHKAAQAFADNFVANKVTVACQLDNERRRQQEEQRARLFPIVKTVILCGRLGIALRGHRDDGWLDVEKPVSASQGNFRSLLTFRVDAGDTVLKQHLATAGKNATYISKTTQNELIRLCGDVISDRIVEDVTKAKYFSVLCDETTDSSHQEQLCLCLRFIDCVDDKHRIREEFVEFQSAVDLTGEGLAAKILRIIHAHQLDVQHMVGQGYDGAASMAGCFSGVQKKIRDAAPLATYVHCASHVLNLVLNTGSSVSDTRNMFGTVREITTFINDSAKRRTVARIALGDNGGRALVTFCETRFVQRHDALLVFLQQYGSTIDAMQTIAAEAKNRKAVDKANSFLRAMTDSAFIVSLCCAYKVMAVTIVLSRSLQKVNQDLFQAMEQVDFVRTTLEKWRQGSGDHDDEWETPDGVYSVACRLAQTANVELTVPRLVGKQTTRNNVVASTASEYYKRAIWYPFLDCTLQSLRDKFSTHHLTLLKLIALVPSVMQSYDWSDIVDSCRLYQSQLSSEDEVRHEYEQWKAICLRMAPSNRPSTPVHTLDIVPPRLINIVTLLRIFCMLPVSTCTAERAFSAMKLLKTYVRNTMTDDRLTGLALMYIHPEVEIDVANVIRRFMAMPAKTTAARQAATDDTAANTAP